MQEDASITALAQRFQMTLTGMKEHVHVVERAGLVTTEKVGRVRTRIKVPVDRRRRSAAGEPVRYQRRAGSGGRCQAIFAGWPGARRVACERRPPQAGTC